MHSVFKYFISVFSFLFALFDDAFYESLSILKAYHKLLWLFRTLRLHYLIAIIIVHIYPSGLHSLGKHQVFLLLDFYYFAHTHTITFGMSSMFLSYYFLLKNFL